MGSLRASHRSAPQGGNGAEFLVSSGPVCEANTARPARIEAPFPSALTTGELREHGIRPMSKRVPGRAVVFYKGDPATHFYIVVSGRVKVSAPSDDGKEITFAILGPGEPVGEMSFLMDTEHTATVTALEPTELALLTREEFLSLVTHSPTFALKLLRILSERLRGTAEMAEDMWFLSLPARLAKKLLELAEAYGEPAEDGVRIGLHLCQQELANLVSSSRESVNKHLAAWQAKGLLKQNHGRLVITRLAEFSLVARTRPSPATEHV